jgi:uncharacterized protein (DUF433 family)
MLTMSDWRDRIVMNPDILVGKPTVKGTRISVELILGWLGNGWSVEEVLQNYPQIKRDDVLAALSFAAQFMRDEHFLMTQAEDTPAE